MSSASESVKGKGKAVYLELTNGAIGDKGLVVEAENLGDIVEVAILDDKGPLHVVHAVVEVGYDHVGTPVVLVIEIHMPVQQGSVVFPRCVDPSCCQQLQAASVT